MSTKQRPERVEGWRCPHCRKFYVRETACASHIPMCWDNKNRHPRIGELSTQASQWRADERWHPGRPGACYTEEGWRDVPGYKAERVPGGWKDVWPDVLVTWEVAKWGTQSADELVVQHFDHLGGDMRAMLLGDELPFDHDPFDFDADMDVERAFLSEKD